MEINFLVAGGLYKRGGWSGSGKRFVSRVDPWQLFGGNLGETEIWMLFVGISVGVASSD